MRAFASILLVVVAACLGGCTTVVQLRNEKGEKVTCGGEMWTLTTAANDAHCLQYFHQLGYNPVH